jgi:hypothetical protein
VLLMNVLRRAALGIAAASVALAPAAALAKRGGDSTVRAQGRCTGGSTSKLTLRPENGRIEVEFEVDQNRNGVRWTVTLTRNGSRVVSTAATTKPPSGSFTVRRLLANGPGRDTVVARATRRSGEVCIARASL